MSRSLKKGPYIDIKLEKKVMSNIDSGKKNRCQNLVQGINDFLRNLSDKPSPFIMEINSFRYILLRIWWDTN